MTEAARDVAQQENPEIFELLDWPELRAAFTLKNDVAKRAKSVGRRTALIGVAAAGIGAAILATAPLLDKSLLKATSLVGLILTLFGGGYSVFHLLQRSGRTRWLPNRAKAERIRQFYFQFIINNLSMHLDALGSEEGKAKLRKERERALTKALFDLDRKAAETPNLYIDDHLHDQVWQDPAWLDQTFPKGLDAKDRERLALLLERLMIQRHQVQLRYAEANRQDNISAPTERYKLLEFAANAVSFGLYASAIGAGVQFLLEGSPNLMLALCGAFGAIGVSLRLIQRGLGLRADAERYDWYVEAIKSCIQQYESGNTAQKIHSFRKVEEFAYSEMRQFLRVHHDENVL